MVYFCSFFLYLLFYNKVFSCIHRVFISVVDAFTGLKCLSQVGVRKLIDESFNCAYFTLNPNVFESSSEKHGELVEFIKRWFEGLEKGVKCTTEYPLSLDVVKGKADVVCVDNQGVVHIVEAKSTQIHHARMQDLFQLMLYVYMYSEVNKIPVDRINAYVAYRYGKRHDTFAYIVKVGDELRKPYLLSYPLL